jgi:hypothetical protein
MTAVGGGECPQLCAGRFAAIASSLMQRLREVTDERWRAENADRPDCLEIFLRRRAWQAASADYLSRLSL